MGWAINRMIAYLYDQSSGNYKMASQSDSPGLFVLGIGRLTVDLKY